MAILELENEYSQEFIDKIGIAPSGKPWSYGIRTCANDGRAYNDFMWPLEIGARAECHDWQPVAKCGFGLHANKFGLEDLDLLEMGDFENQLLIVRWDSDLEVDLKGKHKFPWAEIVAVDKVANWAKIYAQLAELRNEHLREVGRLSSTNGTRAHSSTTGVEAHSSTTGASSIAVAIGIHAKAKASKNGAIMLSRFDITNYPYQLTHVFAGMVGKKYGETTLKPDVWYSLNDKGQPVEAA